ncbi:MAG: hypothetical protein ACOC0Y_01895 [Spirochaetota bacterium]
MNNPEATREALSILRSGEDFQWYVITLLALAIYVYTNEAAKKNWKGIAAGLALYTVHWFYEILNALIQHLSGHALWTVPTGTSFLILIGVGIELSLMFAIAGVLLSKLLPADPNMKILGINNRIIFAVSNAALFSIIEIFLVRTPTFVWVYPWWGALPVFVTVYIPFFLAAFFCHDWKPRKQIVFIGAFAAVDVVLMVVFAGGLGWI